MENNLILDIGMHKGEDTAHYLKKGFRVIGIEADPRLADYCRVKFKAEIAKGQLKIINAGIASEEGVLPFYRNLRLSEWSSFNKESGTRNNTPYEVLNIPCITTKNLFEKYGIPYYMKTDIEGFDLFCLLDIPDEGEKPIFVSCEASQLKCLDILYQKGYKKFKLISQGNHFNPINIQKEKNFLFPYSRIFVNGIKLRVQIFFPFKYPYGSSGPFGEDTKGEWKTYEEIKKVFREFHQFEKNKPLNKVSWFDCHATIEGSSNS